MCPVSTISRFPITTSHLSYCLCRVWYWFSASPVTLRPFRVPGHTVQSGGKSDRGVGTSFQPRPPRPPSWLAFSGDFQRDQRAASSSHCFRWTQRPLLLVSEPELSFLRIPLTIPLNRKVKRFPFSTRPLSVPRGLIKEDVGLFPLPGQKLEKDTTWSPSSSHPPLSILYPRPASKSWNKYLFGASTQPLLCLPRVGWGQCLGPQSSPQ